VPLAALLPHVPTVFHHAVARSRYLAARSNTLVVHADESRKQADNAQTCYRRLHEAIAHAARDAVPAETSPEQMQRVKNLCVDLP
jgi:peptidyl-tRNA hydrolase ICT1